MHVPSPAWQCMCQCWQFSRVQLMTHVPAPAMYKPTSALAPCGPMWPHKVHLGPERPRNFFSFILILMLISFPSLVQWTINGYSVLTVAFDWIQPWLLKYSNTARRLLCKADALMLGYPKDRSPLSSARARDIFMSSNVFRFHAMSDFSVINKARRTGYALFCVFLRSK